MNNMSELVAWFQLEYPDLVESMKKSNHHLTDKDQFILDAKNGGAPYSQLQGAKGYPVNLNPFHLEGDIFCHTMMVCKQAENAPYLVKLAALLHDIGKPSSRNVNAENGRVSFYNHDAVSAFMSLEILKRPELGLSRGMISHVFNLITLHTQVYKLSIDQLADIEDRLLIEDLLKLGKADHDGRFHTKEDVVIPTMADIAGVCGMYMKEGVHWKLKEKEVTVLVGLPGSGKSTWVHGEKKLRPETYVVSRDAIITGMFPELTYNEAYRAVKQRNVDRELQALFKEAKGEESVIVDMTHMSKKSRRRSLSHFDSSYKKKAVVFLTDLQLLKLRNETRDGKVIDSRVIDRMMKSFYPVTYAEFDEIEYVL